MRHSNLSAGQASGRLIQVVLSMGITASFLGANLVHAQSNVKARSVDYIVAVVNSEPITNNEVQNLKFV